jgi:hypothetical protein
MLSKELQLERDKLESIMTSMRKSLKNLIELRIYMIEGQN